MILKMARNIIVAGGLALVVVGCSRQQPVYNVVSHPIPAAVTQISLPDMQRAIVLAGTDRGWTLVPVEPGHLKGHIDHNGHSADIEVLFTTGNYSISYVTSANLLATSDGLIHTTYNKWIHQFESDIDRQIIRLALS
ncbi:hypothetical protein [Telmatospirillum siberiense]|uniref:Lipoprotein n=1 Tax=Telmatospirillum siberiense TaxID=382514 RepID=A0A2N3PW26_9PROT|nr:hypothetical protein [Telmatospirillum siberiense]PKU24600.1 hypothetical protein CWS72_10900 [Telmatospirillum siberiense]